MKTAVSLMTVLVTIAMLFPGTVSAQNAPPPSADLNSVLPPPTQRAPPASFAQPDPAGAPTTGPALYYRGALAPYGTWMCLEPYGWVWQPALAVVNPSWRPYYNDGQWVWMGTAWYWQSNYAWGWAPFHYGRWLLAAGAGWVWIPDLEWGPAWVRWMESDTCYGWAPLPPCQTTGGIGFGIAIQDGNVSWNAQINMPCNRHVYVPRHCDSDDGWYRHEEHERRDMCVRPAPVCIPQRIVMPVVVAPAPHWEAPPAPRPAPTRRAVEISQTVAPTPPRINRRPANPHKPAAPSPAPRQNKPEQIKAKPAQETSNPLPAANSRAMRVARLLAQ